DAAAPTPDPTAPYSLPVGPWPAILDPRRSESCGSGRGAGRTADDPDALPRTSRRWPPPGRRERLPVDPALRTVVGGRAKEHAAALTSEVARFETETLTTRENVNRLVGQSGQWIDGDRRANGSHLGVRSG